MREFVSGAGRGGGVRTVCWQVLACFTDNRHIHKKQTNKQKNPKCALAIEPHTKLTKVKTQLVEFA